MVSAVNVANNILQKGFNTENDITPMKLQKLTYLVFKKYYQDTQTILFPERFEVWKYGPVVRSIYNEFKKYGGNVIREYGKDLDGSILIVNEVASPQFKNALDTIWKKYGEYGGIPLSEMTHRQGTAWYKAVQRKDLYLSNEDIKEEEVFL
ncbi:type II toxin-antitoxin system antitoxin SocA domain-containing protein [Lachnospiraceae bacterium 29-91]